MAGSETVDTKTTYLYNAGFVSATNAGVDGYLSKTVTVRGEAGATKQISY